MKYGGAIALTGAVLLIACHPDIILLESIHIGRGLEETCIRLGDTTEQITVEDIEQWVGEALNKPLTNDDWEGVNGVGFDSLGDCDDLSPAQFDGTEIRYIVGDDLSPPCPPATPCALPVQPGTAHSDHTDFESWNVRIPTSFILGASRTHWINHETGHVLGLADPTPVKNPPAVEHCIMPNDSDLDMVFEFNHPVPSIMHNPGQCGDNAAAEFSYPTEWDRIGVEIQVFDDP